MRRREAAVGAVLFACAILVGANRPAGAATDLGAIACGGSVFHEEKSGAAGSGLYSLPIGPVPVPTGYVDALCALGAPCFDYTLTVNDDCGGFQLRIAYDTPERDDNFEMRVEDPTGFVTTARNSNHYSVETFHEGPASGVWKIRIAPYSADDAPFRLRAKLDAVKYVPPANGLGQRLPNLRVTRMWEFGFAAPANPLNGLFPPDDVNPPLAVAGEEPVSCALDEQLGFDGEPAQRCLRYSFGLANVGDGVFDVRWTTARTDTEPYTMTQCIETTSGVPDANENAGTGEFHPTHGHFHYHDIIHHDLFRVVYDPADPEAAPDLDPTGAGKKIGYSPADQGMPLWEEFTQERSGTSGNAGNCAPGSTNRLGMSRGWGDAYRYQRPGNFVSFGTNGDGEYVVTTTADPDDVVRETDESDNTSYAWVSVSGNDVEILETGLGAHPWDPAKVVYEDWWVSP